MLSSEILLENQINRKKKKKKGLTIREVLYTTSPFRQVGTANSQSMLGGKGLSRWL